MGNIYTGSNSGKAGLNVKKTDDTVDVFGVSQIQLDSNLTLTNNGNGSVTIQSSGGGGGGGMTSWTIGSTSGANQTVSNGQVVDVVGGTGISGAIGGTRTVTLDLDDTAVTAGSYTNASITVDAQGRLTSASSGTAPATGTGSAGQVTYWSGASTIAGDNDFVFDSANKRVGIGLTAPAVDLEIRATDDDRAELRVSRNDTQYTEIMNEDASGGFIFNSSPQSNKKPLRIDAVHNNTGVAAGTLYIDLRLGQSVESGGTPSVYFRATEEGLNSEPEVVVNESSGSVNFRVETTSNTQAFFMDGSADTASFNVPVTINQQSNALSTDFALQLTEDTADPNQSPDFFLYKDSATPTDGDDIGSIQFYGNNAASSGGAKNLKHLYGSIIMDMADVITNQESGRMFFQILKAGTLRQGITLRGDGSGSVVIGDGNVGLGADGIDFRVETNTQNEAFQIDTSADTAQFNIDVGIGTTPTSSLHVSTADNIIAKFLSTDGTAAIELADNATTNNAVLTRVGQTLTLCANGGDVAFGNSIGSYNGATPTDGQLLIGDTASGVFDKGTLTSTGGTVTITNGAGTINLEAAGGGGGTPAGSNTEIQFNNAGAFGASSRFTFNSGTNAFTVGSALGGTPVTFSQSASDGVAQGGNITSNATTVSMELNTGFTLAQEIGVKQTTTKFQVETGKTTTQSFGQTEKIITGTGTYNCWPSEGGMIVVDDVAGAGAISLNLVLAQDPVGQYEPNANPPNATGGGTPVTGIPDKAGYGTWQIGDQVTVVASYASGNTPAISVQSCTLLSDGLGGSGDPVLDPSRAAKINGVNSNSTPNTITTNYTAKTYILVTNISETLGVSWVAIG